MELLRVGVIGVGHLGSLHAKMFSTISQVKLVGVYDVNRERAQLIANENKTQPYISIDELFKDVNAVSIATPTITHYEIAKNAIEKGIHVFIEKPITNTVDEAESIVKLARERGTIIQVGHIERFNPALLALEKYNLQPMFIESHRLAQFNPRGTDVAVVLDLMIHDIDIILSLVKSSVKRIEANGVAVVSDQIDIANARLQFENGCVANVTASRISQRKMRKMRLFQKDAYISIDFSDGVVEVFRLVDENEKTEDFTMMLGQINAGKRNRNIVYERPEIKEINALKYELELFVGSIQNNKMPVVSGEEGCRALKVAHDILDKINQQEFKV